MDRFEVPRSALKAIIRVFAVKAFDVALLTVAVFILVVAYLARLIDELANIFISVVDPSEFAGRAGTVAS